MNEKFRAWDGFISEMIHSTEGNSMSAFWLDVETRRGNGHEVLVMRFIGRKDKTGRDMYEEDKVRYSHAALNSGLPLIYTGVIKWMPDHCKYVTSNESYFDIIWGEIEVIGNTCQDPDLPEMRDRKALENGIINLVRNLEIGKEGIVLIHAKGDHVQLKIMGVHPGDVTEVIEDGLAFAEENKP